MGHKWQARRGRGAAAMTLVALAATLVGVAAAPAGAAPTRVAEGAKAGAWKVGDCYEEAEVDADLVELDSKIACSKDHAVQVVGGAPLPKDIAAFPRGVLTTPGNARSFLSEFATNTCAPQKVVGNLYPKSGKALSKLFAKYEVTDWMIPLAGRMGWVLPDPTSYAAGATDVLCIYEPDGTLTDTTAGDAMKVATRDPIPTLRLCYSFRADNSGADFVACDEKHDVESLIWVGMPVTTQPANAATWSDADWAPFDKVCEEFGAAVIGGKQKQLLVRADTDITIPANNGTRFFNCRTYPESEKVQFAAGEIATGAGNAKLKLVKK